MRETLDQPRLDVESRQVRLLVLRSPKSEVGELLTEHRCREIWVW